MKRTSISDQFFTTTISSRGQVVLPAKVRRKMRLRKGMRLNIVLPENGRKQIVLQPLDFDPIANFRGALPNADALEFLERERKKDRERGR